MRQMDCPLTKALCFETECYLHGCSHLTTKQSELPAKPFPIERLKAWLTEEANAQRVFAGACISKPNEVARRSGMCYETQEVLAKIAELEAEENIGGGEKE